VDKALILLDVLKSYAPDKDALLEINKFYTHITSMKIFLLGLILNVQLLEL
jgi:hypothetical protein